MNAAELIQNVLALKPTERQPVSVFSGGAWALSSGGLSLERALASPPETTAELLYRMYSSVDSDIFWAVSGFNNIVIGAIGGKIKFRSRGTPDVIETLLKKASDADHIDLDRIRDDEKIRTLYEVSRLLVKKASGDHHPVALTRWGPFTLAGLLYGAENLMRDIYRDPQAVRHILDFTSELYLRYTEPYIENGVEIMLIAEPTSSGDMISRRHFEDFALPVFKRIFAALRKKGALAAIHICGDIENRLDLLAVAGAHFVSVDYKVSLKKARAAFNGKVAFGGNMNPVKVMQQATAEELALVCEQCIADAGDGGGFILMPGCDLPPSTPVENVRTMIRTGQAHVYHSRKVTP
ncbi:MAG: uroporphyrinogen decarboxylase family protein [Treponema sp.]|jgi:uroporphyrinogen decarboxylase|nr:uroporphyrinogen decarboxylase family protein [Treponema sp.]